MELAIPVARGEVWAEDTGGDGPPLVLMRAPDALAGIIGELVR
jgi:hypothetical protein